MLVDILCIVAIYLYVLTASGKAKLPHEAECDTERRRQKALPGTKCRTSDLCHSENAKLRERDRTRKTRVRTQRQVKPTAERKEGIL